MKTNIKINTLIKWEYANREVVLRFECIAYAMVQMSTQNVAVILMDETLFPNNAFLYSPMGKLIKTIETKNNTLCYTGFAPSSSPSQLLLISVDEFFRYPTFASKIFQRKQRYTLEYVNIINESGNIIDYSIYK